LNYQNNYIERLLLVVKYQNFLQYCLLFLIFLRFQQIILMVQKLFSDVYQRNFRSFSKIIFLYSFTFTLQYLFYL